MRRNNLKPLLITLGVILSLMACVPPRTPTPTEATPTPRLVEATPTPQIRLFRQPPTPPARTQAQVLRVIDGDTIEVSIGGKTYKVRYIGIDTPETKHPEKPVEWMGAEAAAKNEELVGGRIVGLEKDVSETDRYGRLLRYVWIGDLMVNAELVRLGFAQVSTYPPDVKYQDLFLRLQKEAREAQRGLWGPTPTAIVQPTPTPQPAGAEPVVYITKTGEKYHRDGCRYLSESKIAITCAEAIRRGYTPCGVCKPECP